MELFHTVRMILGIILFAGVSINFFYQGIRALKKLRKIEVSEETIHHFKCRHCEETYEMNGADYNARVSIWSPKMEKRTPKSQTSAIRFECPQCQKKAFQEKIYDTNVTAGLGNVRAQFDDSSRDVLVEVLIKGIIPIFIIVPVLGLLL